MNSDTLIEAQRHLRRHLDSFSSSDAIAGASDLAAHLLLYLDDPARCWQLTLQWLRRTVDADRVHGGFTQQFSNVYRLVEEAVRGDIEIPSTVGVEIDARQEAVREVLVSHRPVLYSSICDDVRFSSSLRSQMLAMHTQAKLAFSLHDGDEAIGIICCDWTSVRQRWHAEQCEQITQFVTGVLSPVFSLVYQEREQALAMPTGNKVATERIHLTPAELKVARLIVQGMSYKEIARQLDRSFSTVDHSLRSIRDKLGARSTARMVAALGELLRRHYS